ncbi:uncharacterized protein N7487_009149 [Penicillium crustosum]|uniref:uncharacterized protein n=1 Tax=Penicillium crustosum TaxID=36656 RepID=UPI002392EF6B|nr:uncharacterized protein N7487_009149 [Penicillium crustosum]KAJ5394846.1 hypothetical protein N7487_009149 [Penicillium crustosum]
MGISITLDDYVFGINLTQDTKNFQVDQNNPNATDYKTCERNNVHRGSQTDFLVGIDDPRIWSKNFGSANEP